MLSPMHSGKWTELNCLVQFPAVHWTGDDLYYSRWNWQSSQVLHNRTKFSWIGRKEINHRTKMSDKRWPYCRRFSSVTKPSPVITTSRRLRKAIDHRTKMSDEQRWPCRRRFSSVMKPSPVITASHRFSAQWKTELNWTERPSSVQFSFPQVHWALGYMLESPIPQIRLHTGSCVSQI